MRKTNLMNLNLNDHQERNKTPNRLGIRISRHTVCRLNDRERKRLDSTASGFQDGGKNHRITKTD